MREKLWKLFLICHNHKYRFSKRENGFNKFLHALLVTGDIVSQRKHNLNISKIVFFLCNINKQKIYKKNIVYTTSKLVRKTKQAEYITVITNILETIRKILYKVWSTIYQQISFFQ